MLQSWCGRGVGPPRLLEDLVGRSSLRWHATAARLAHELWQLRSVTRETLPASHPSPLLLGMGSVLTILRSQLHELSGLKTIRTVPSCRREYSPHLEAAARQVRFRGWHLWAASRHDRCLSVQNGNTHCLKSSVRGVPVVDHTSRICIMEKVDLNRNESECVLGHSTSALPHKWTVFVTILLSDCFENNCMN